MDPGLRAEERGLEAIQELQKSHWSFREFVILKFARTTRHKDPKIRALDSKKIDLIVVFKRENCFAGKQDLRIFVLQVKSTLKSYHEFINHRKFRRSIMCVLIREDDPMPRILKKMRKIFQRVLSMRRRKNPYFRPYLPIDRF